MTCPQCSPMHARACTHTHMCLQACAIALGHAHRRAQRSVFCIYYIYIINYIIIVSFNMCRFAILHFVFVWASRQSFQRMTFLVAQGLDCKALLSLLLVPAQSLVVPQWTKGVTTGLVVLVWRLLIRRVGDPHAEANVTDMNQWNKPNAIVLDWVCKLNTSLEDLAIRLRLDS